MLEHRNGRTEPSFFARALDVERTLADEPPDVVIVQDLAAPAYTALRMRQLGFGFEETLFVVFCHGTRQWITDAARKTRVLPGALAIGVVEQASVELADVVVSPSMYLLDWMRGQGWGLPQASRVIPYLTRSVATDESIEPPPEAAPIARIVFFGRLEERKGIRPFAAGVDGVRDLLDGIELEFLGGPTEPWPTDRVAALLPDGIEATFSTGLDQRDALERLRRPGTLAVMPSLEDNSPNAVYECIEHGIPFIASRTGGVAELVAPEDRERVLFTPTGEGVAIALRRVLTADAFAPGRFAFDPKDATAAWEDVLKTPIPQPADHPSGDFILLGDNAPREQLERAQAASGADVVTCGLMTPNGVEHYFLGDPGALGLLSNSYGTVALVRRSLVRDEREPVWPLLARAVLGGAKAVSIPRPLVESRAPSADDSLAVLQEFERSLAHGSRLLARLAAGLAAQSTSAQHTVRRRLSKLIARR
jgi:glycosyltransferase involved in cell wall biosynthesis